MDRLITLTSREELERWQSLTDLRPVAPLELAQHHPDAHWMSIGDGAALGARCSLWWTRTPSLPGHQVGIIGHYAARDTAARLGMRASIVEKARSLLGPAEAESATLIAKLHEQKEEFELRLVLLDRQTKGLEARRAAA